VLVTLKLEKSVTSIPELSRAIDAFETIDEVYRLMKSIDSIRPNSKIDFRRKPFKDIKGGELDRFSVTSPPEITVNADNLWVAALIYILKDYSNIKKNISEASHDASIIGSAIQGLSEQEIQNAIIGAKLFSEKLSEVGEDNMKWLTKKIEAARRVLYKDNIKSLSSDNDENA
jgi:hypothetical protein